jgi:hypothetical protein
MKTLPNGVTIFNATPHAIRFWREDWIEPVEVETDAIVNAKAQEEIASVENGVTFVTTTFVAIKDENYNKAFLAYKNGAIVVGSIIAAQAFPKTVVAMTPAPGYERVPPDQKRMNPDKFTVF